MVEKECIILKEGWIRSVQFAKLHLLQVCLKWRESLDRSKKNESGTKFV